MVYVAETIPDHLKNDPAVIHFQPIQGWPTATQAQVIRLLYPALLTGDGAIILSDMDMVPMQDAYFHKGFESFAQNQFVSLRGIDEEEKQVYICYVGATPQTWRDLFGIQTVQDIRNRMETWSQQAPADGLHGGVGWCTDQQILYVTVKHWQQIYQDRIGLIPWTPSIPRLDRGNPTEWIEYSPQLERNIQQKYYVDFHMPPYSAFKLYIDGVLSLTTNQHS
jgi:hypothetical protein